MAKKKTTGRRRPTDDGRHKTQLKSSGTPRPQAGCGYQRVVLKVSGEGFGLPGGFGIDGSAVQRIAREVVSVTGLGTQVAVVVGGGNFLRGATLASRVSIQEATAHYMGMLATVMNALALQDMLEDCGQPTRVQSTNQG